jgi:hypothetical protein
MQAEKVTRESKEQVMRELEAMAVEKEKVVEELRAKQREVLEQVDLIGRKEAEILQLRDAKPGVQIIEKIVT